MIDYQLFKYSAAPRTGTTWIIQAADIVGLGVGYKSHVHVPFRHESGLRVSSVRHPCSWLASYFSTIRGGFIGVPCVDVFCQLPTDDFDDFIRKYLLRIPGEVGRMFASYQAETYLRLEDYPWNFVELLDACTMPKNIRERCISIPKQNAISEKRSLPKWNPLLRKRVLEAENDMLEHFGYV